MNQYTPISLLVPTIPDEASLRPYLAQIDFNKHYSNFGPLVKALEARLADLFQTHSSFPTYVTTVSSATLGLELALSSLDLAKGSNVLVPALTFVATLTTIIRAGFTPVIADIDYDSWLLTPEIAKTALKESDIKAVLAVATFGQPQDTVNWSNFQKNTGLKVIIDAAGAFGSQWVNAPDITVVYSMHATKSLAAGEGGFVVSGNAQLSGLIRQLSNFGISLNSDEGQPVGYLAHVGTNAKLSEYHAAVAHASLDVWSHIAKKRADIYSQYQFRLKETCGDAVIFQSGIDLPAPNTLSIRVGSNSVMRNLEKICADRKISTRRWYQPLLHHHSATIKPMVALSCPVAEHIASDMIGLPFSIFLSNNDLNRIVNAVKEALKSST